MGRRDLGLSILNAHSASREDDDDLKTNQRIRIGRFLFTKKSLFAAGAVAVLLAAAAVVCAVYLPPLLNKRVAVPVAGSGSIRMLVIGDSGVGNKTQMDVARQMSLYASNQGLPFHALLHVGDAIYFNGDPQHFYNWITVPYLSPLQAREFVLALGNHDTFWVDGGAAMLAFANMTSRYVEKVFTSSDGTSMQLIVLDSNCLAHWWRNPSTLNETLAAEQAAFLDSKLAQGAYTWRVVSFHHPVFSCSRQFSTTNVSKEWMPIISKRGNVNLVLSGHSHNYQRFQQLGTTFVVTGGGGITTDAYEPCPQGTPEPQVFVRTNQFMAVHASAFKLSLVAVDLNGQTIDSFIVSQK